MKVIRGWNAKLIIDGKEIKGIDEITFRDETRTTNLLAMAGGWAIIILCGLMLFAGTYAWMTVLRHAVLNFP